MRLRGVVRLRCAWFGSGQVQLCLCPAGETLEATLARRLFGEKPHAGPAYEAAERLFMLEVEATPVQEGLQPVPTAPPAWCDGCQARFAHCTGGAAERQRCLELCRAEEAADDR